VLVAVVTDGTVATGLILTSLVELESLRMVLLAVEDSMSITTLRAAIAWSHVKKWVSGIGTVLHHTFITIVILVAVTGV
tara:strand:+ start:257 stop:493 length:237 start_codon:yes stop_codon:yes gene_type:complete